MGNSSSNDITEETLRAKYEEVMKANQHVEVLITFAEARSQLWYNKSHIPEEIFAELLNQEIEASVEEISRATFKLNVFNTLVKFVPLNFTQADQTIDFARDKELVERIRQFVYVKAYLSPEGSEEKEYWMEFVNTMGKDALIKKMDAWDRQWRNKI